MKKIFAYLICGTLIISMLGCGSPNIASVDNVETDSPSNSEEIVTETVYPLTITDQAGREVVIDSEPQTLVSGYYITSSLLIALGLEDKVVGIEAKANQRHIYQFAAPQLLDLPNVGTAKEFDLEGCAALAPDLVILPIKLKNAADSLSELGIQVLLVNPESKEQLLEAINLIAQATNTVSKANELLDYISNQQDKLTESLEGTTCPSVYFAGNSDLLSTAGASMYQSSLIESAGGINVAAEIEDNYWSEISYEQLLSWDPDYIILASDASYSVEDVMNDANLSECTAIRNNNVYIIPGDIEAIDSPVPSSILASIWLAGILHPDNVSADDFSSEQSYYYETFYDFTN